MTVQTGRRVCHPTSSLGELDGRVPAQVLSQLPRTLLTDGSRAAAGTELTRAF